MSVAIIPDFVKYQIEWLTSHKHLEFEPVIEDAIVEMLKDTGKSFIDEQHAETSQFDHIAESDRKVSISCAHENDLVSRKAAIEAINGMIDRFERLLADIRESKGDDSVCGMCEYDGAYMGQSGDWCNECPGFDKDDCFKLSDRCRKRWMGDIVLPSAQPTLCGYNIEHLILIANVLRKENLPPERVVEALTDIGRIVSIVKDEFEESLRKAVEQCKV